MESERLIDLYRTMVRIRAFEEAAERAGRGGFSVLGAAACEGAQVKGPLHLSIGQEAVAAGVCFCLKAGDYITSTHRGHGHTLAKGASLAAMTAELFGRVTGTNSGKGGSMHIADFRVGVLGANGIVAAGIPIAVGVAHAIKIRGGEDVVACFFGDGALNRGPFLEGLNWAKVFDLPILFVCEDNQYAATTKTGSLTGGPGAVARAEAMGIAGRVVDGNNVIEVVQAAEEMVARLRRGDGPQFLHALTYRLKGHVSVDQAPYRDPEEVARARERDPLKIAEGELIRRGIGRVSLEAIRREVEDQMEQALAAAGDAPYPAPVEAYSHVQDCGAGQWF